MKRKEMYKKSGWLALAFIYSLYAEFICAQSEGATAISTATSELKSWYDPIKGLIWVLAGCLGLVGAIKMFNKFNSADPETSKSAAMLLGGCVALYVAEILFRTMFINK